MENKLKHGAIEPSYEDGVWYCPHHRSVNISSKKPCFTCKEIVDNTIAEEQIRDEQLMKETKAKEKIEAKLEGIKKNCYVYCKYCETYIKKSSNKGVFVGDWNVNTFWNKHIASKKHLKNKRRWYENTSKSKL